MRIAAVVGTPGDAVAGLTQGDELLIYDTEANKVERYRNPAKLFDQHRRAMVIKFLQEAKVQAVCAVPEGFCNHSYGLAKNCGLTFAMVEPGAAFVPEQAAAWAQATVPELPRDWVHSHGHKHEHKHEHKHDHGAGCSCGSHENAAARARIEADEEWDPHNS